MIELKKLINLIRTYLKVYVLLNLAKKSVVNEQIIMLSDHQVRVVVTICMF